MSPGCPLSVCDWDKICNWVSSNAGNHSRNCSCLLSQPFITSQKDLGILEGINRARNECD